MEMLPLKDLFPEVADFLGDDDETVPQMGVVTTTLPEPGSVVVEEEEEERGSVLVPEKNITTTLPEPEEKPIIRVDDKSWIIEKEIQHIVDTLDPKSQDSLLANLDTVVKAALFLPKRTKTTGKRAPKNVRKDADYYAFTYPSVTGNIMRNIKKIAIMFPADDKGDLLAYHGSYFSNVSPPQIPRFRGKTTIFGDDALLNMRDFDQVALLFPDSKAKIREILRRDYPLKNRPLEQNISGFVNENKKLVRPPLPDFLLNDEPMYLAFVQKYNITLYDFFVDRQNSPYQHTKWALIQILSTLHLLWKNYGFIHGNLTTKNVAFLDLPDRSTNRKVMSIKEPKELVYDFRDERYGLRVFYHEPSFGGFPLFFMKDFSNSQISYIADLLSKARVEKKTGTGTEWADYELPRWTKTGRGKGDNASDLHTFGFSLLAAISLRPFHDQEKDLIDFCLDYLIADPDDELHIQKRDGKVPTATIYREFMKKIRETTYLGDVLDDTYRDYGIDSNRGILEDIATLISPARPRQEFYQSPYFDDVRVEMNWNHTDYRVIDHSTFLQLRLNSDLF